MEYYSTMKRGILSFVTTWMDLEDIMLSEITQRKTNIICFHLYVDSKKAKPPETEIRMVVPRAWGGEEQVMLVKESNFQL